MAGQSVVATARAQPKGAAEPGEEEASPSRSPRSLAVPPGAAPGSAGGLRRACSARWRLQEEAAKPSRCLRCLAAPPGAAPDSAGGLCRACPSRRRQEEETNLRYFHKWFFASSSPSVPSFKKVKSLKECKACKGKAVLYSCDGRPFVAKRIPTTHIHSFFDIEPNDLVAFRSGTKGRRDDPATEIGVLRALSLMPSCVSLVQLLGILQVDEMAETWICTEYAEHSDLFDLVCKTEGGLPGHQVRGVMRQLFEATAHLHRHCIGHMDISLENALCYGFRELDQMPLVKLMDFGQAVLLQSPDGRAMRFFCIRSKDASRAPECYSPPYERWDSLQAVCPEQHTPTAVYADVFLQEADARDPGALPAYQCEVFFPRGSLAGESYLVEPAGYRAAPADVFALGTVGFTLATRMPPWRQARYNNADKAWGWLQEHDGAVGSLFTTFKKPRLDEEGMKLLDALLDKDPSKRPSAAEALGGSWLAAEGAAAP